MSEYLPGLAGVPATKSNISYLDGDVGLLAYRGYRIEELAQQSSFEETTLLLLNGELPTRDELDVFDQQIRNNRIVKYNVRQIMQNLPATGHPMEMLQTAVASLGMFYPSDSSDNDEEYSFSMATKIVARMGTIVTMWEHIRNGYDPNPPRKDLTYAENLLYMFHGEEPDPEMARIMDACLVLHAEHTINASTFAALVAASTLASPYLVVAAAIGTLAGPLHGGANEKVVHMLEQVGDPGNAKAWVNKQLDSKGKIWGMGHREYSVKDPRATFLQKMMMDWANKKGNISPMFETALALEEACEERLAEKGVFPNVDFYSGILYREMGIPIDQFTPIFAISRSAGWLAHWREQLSDNRIFRPTQVYTGLKERSYIPMGKR
ncbi:MAG: citrate synthase [Gammaproteobacteria bacterium]|nr:citrate synthase [Gammaproteobacteria bacterium]